MTYQEIYNIISNIEGKEANVWITTKESNKRYKMNLRITTLNILKMRDANSKCLGYNVSQMHADKWEKIDIIKPRKKKC